MAQNDPYLNSGSSPFYRSFAPLRRCRGLWLAMLLLSGAWPELVLHLVTARTAATLLNPGLLLAPVFGLVPGLLLYAVCRHIPSRGVNMGLTIVYSLLYFFFCAAQMIYYHIFGYFFSFYSMRNGAQAFQFFDIVLETIFFRCPLPLLCMAMPCLLICVFGWVAFAYRSRLPRRNSTTLLVLAVAIALQACAVLTLPLWEGKDPLSVYSLYYNGFDAYSSVNKLGVMTALRLDIQHTLLGKEDDSEITITTPIPDPTSDSAVSQPESIPTTAPTESPVELNMLDLGFESLLSGEYVEEIQQLTAYFQSKTPSAKNDKTGLFAGCNLVQITAESFSHLAIDRELTPTLYKLQTQGFNFTNFYTPSWGTSTIDGEYAHLTGYLPKSGVWSFQISTDNYMPLTMTKQLMDLGYSARAYHNHSYDYYTRDQYLANLGFVYKAYGNGLDIDYMWPSSDHNMVDITTEEFVHGSPFYTYYMTVSGHLQYNFTGNSMAKRNQDLVEHLPYSEAVRAFLACQLELEKAVTLLLERLEEAGVLNNTVIVLTADHYPYGLTQEELEELAGHEVETNFQLYRNSLMIYKAGMTPETIDAPCCTMDILPTLLNLFGLEFDSRLYMGRDIFSDAPPLLIFQNHSWITDLATYNSTTQEVTQLTDQQVSQAYIDAICTEVENRFTASAWVLENDYWRLLFKPE